MSDQGINTVGLSDETHAQLRRLKDDGVFAEMVDGYRLGIGLAVAESLIAPRDVRYRTVFNVGTLDPDGSLRDLLNELYGDAQEHPYAIAQRLAEAGVAELGRLHEAKQLRFGELYRRALELSPAPE